MPFANSETESREFLSFFSSEGTRMRKTLCKFKKRVCGFFSTLLYEGSWVPFIFDIVVFFKTRFLIVCVNRGGLARGGSVT